MSVKLVVMCHVEPGTLHDGTIAYDFSHTEGIVPALDRIVAFANRFEVPMGFAMTPQALALARVDFSGHEVGVHLHPMDPALAKRVGDRVRLVHDCLGRYSPEDQAVLLHAAKEAFEEAIGRPPRLFVAGRWSEASATSSLLSREGFTHDASALPGLHSPCADWSRLPRLAQPYRPDARDRQRSGSVPLLYIPVSRGLWGDYMTPERLRDLGPSYFKAALKEAQVGGADVIQFFLHSPLGLDPTVLKAFGEVLRFARENLGIPAVLPTELSASPHARARPFPPAYLAWFDWKVAKSFVGRSDLGRRIMEVSAEQEDASGGDPKRDPGAQRP